MPMPIAIIASEMTITSTSIVSHLGMRFAGWVIAGSPVGAIAADITA